MSASVSRRPVNPPHACSGTHPACASRFHPGAVPARACSHAMPAPKGIPWSVLRTRGAPCWLRGRSGMAPRCRSRPATAPSQALSPRWRTESAAWLVAKEDVWVLGQRGAYLVTAVSPLRTRAGTINIQPDLHIMLWHSHIALGAGDDRRFARGRWPEFPGQVDLDREDVALDLQLDVLHAGT